jgi:HEAT repeat protein
VDVDPELSALTSTAATTVVQLLVTAGWEQAKTAVGGLWRRVHPERAEIVQAELEESRVEMLAAGQAGDGQVEQALIGEWHGRLRRLVAADPQLVDDLRQVVAELRSALADADPPQATTITVQATAFGNSRVNQAGRDLHVTTGE